MKMEVDLDDAAEITFYKYLRFEGLKEKYDYASPDVQELMKLMFTRGYKCGHINGQGHEINFD
jgi:hypothetical protein